MKTYLVTWTIDVDAESPWKAALEAKRIQRDRNSIANVFDVENVRIDLDAPAGSPRRRQNIDAPKKRRVK